MPRRWFRRPAPAAPPADGTSALGALLSRRLLGKRLVMVLPVAITTAWLSQETEEAEAAPATDPWRLGGNANVNTDGTNFLGTKNNAPLIFKTNTSGGGGERMRISATGNVSIGTTEQLGRLMASTSSANQPALYGRSTSSVGVRGESSSGYGVWGSSSSFDGVRGHTTAAYSDTAAGVHGSSRSSIGVYGNSLSNVGVRGESSSGAGVWGESSSNMGVFGKSSSDFGVAGESTSSFGVYGVSSESIGVYGQSASSYAGYFAGDVRVTGSIVQGSAASTIDHPLDPENKYLSLASVESPEMMNISNGNVRLDTDGTATVELPSYFEALSRDFRYQLTAIGAPAPNLHIAKEIVGNRFTIAGGSPGMQVSWQVTGIRRDAYAEAHRVQAEQDKPVAARGTYLHPKDHGQPETKGEDYVGFRRARPDRSADPAE